MSRWLCLAATLLPFAVLGCGGGSSGGTASSMPATPSVPAVPTTPSTTPSPSPMASPMANPMSPTTPMSTTLPPYYNNPMSTTSTTPMSTTLPPYYNNPVSTTTPMPTMEPPVAVEMFAQEIAAMPEAARTKYQGKPITLEGNVVEVVKSTTDNSVIVQLGSAEKAIACEFEPGRPHTQDAEKFAPESKVRVRGTVELSAGGAKLAKCEIPYTSGSYPAGTSPSPMTTTSTPGYTPAYAMGTAGSEAKPKTAVELANDAFRKGKDLDALQFTYAAALVSEEAQETLAEDFKWLPTLKRPSMGVRWGVGVVYSPPRGYTGHPTPIGYEPPAANTNGSPGSPMGSGSPAERPRTRKVFGQGRQNQNPSSSPSSSTSSSPPPSHPPADPADFLTYYTGEIGEKVVELISKRNSSGVHGEVLRRAMDVYDTQPAAGASGSTPYMPMYTTPMAPGAQEKKEAFKPGAIAPGIVMLGEGTKNELIDTAEEHQVDYVIFFEVAVRASGKNVTNNTKFQVLSLEKAKLPQAAADAEQSSEVFASKLINSLRVESAREGKKDDPLDAEIDGFSAAIEAEVAPIPLGEKVSTAEIAAQRTNFLAAKPGENPLASLAEICCYRSQELIDDTQLATAYEAILGPANSKKLLKGKTEAEKLAAITKWLPKAPR